MADRPIRKPSLNLECSVAGCGRKALARDLCGGHYQRWRNTGDPNVELPLGATPFKPPRLCAVGGCNRPGHGHYCDAHTRRLRRHGDVMAHIPLQVKRPPGNCAVSDCQNSRHASGFCRLHYARFKATGDPLVVGRRGRYNDDDDVTYATAHRRIAATRGRSTTHACACGLQAETWAYGGACLGERWGLTNFSGTGQMAAYCLHAEHYTALCARCHKALRIPLLRMLADRAAERADLARKVA